MTDEEKAILLWLLMRSRSKKKATQIAKQRDKEIERIMALPSPLPTKVKLIILAIAVGYGLDEKRLKALDVDEETTDNLFDSLKELEEKVSREILKKAGSQILLAQDRKLAMEDALVMAAGVYALALAKRAGLQSVWVTVHDDRVCPICEELDGQVTTKVPPAHPRCRCTITVRR